MQILTQYSEHNFGNTAKYISVFVADFGLKKKEKKKEVTVLYALTNAQTVAIITFTFRRIFRFLINFLKIVFWRDVWNAVPSLTVVL